MVKLTNDSIIGQLATGKNKGKYLMISRFKFQSEDKTVPFQMERNQFPVKLAFGITANRSQGQTYKFIGINLTHHFFVHGQTYVAMSRVGSAKNIKIYQPKNCPTKGYMKNVVYPEVLSTKNVPTKTLEFSQNGNLDNLVHNGWSIHYKCDSCDKTFTTENNLRIHMDNAHEDQNITINELHSTNQIAQFAKTPPSTNQNTQLAKLPPSANQITSLVKTPKITNQVPQLAKTPPSANQIAPFAKTPPSTNQIARLVKKSQSAPTQPLEEVSNNAVSVKSFGSEKNQSPPYDKKCDFCDKMFQETSNLEAHIITHCITPYKSVVKKHLARKHEIHMENNVLDKALVFHKEKGKILNSPQKTQEKSMKHSNAVFQEKELTNSQSKFQETFLEKIPKTTKEIQITNCFGFDDDDKDEDIIEQGMYLFKKGGRE